MNDLESLPLEVQYKILLDLSYDDIINYCKANHLTASICKDEYFWRQKAKLDGFPQWLMGNTNPHYRYKQLLDYGDCLRGNVAFDCFNRAINARDRSAILYMLQGNVNFNVSILILPALINGNMGDIAETLLVRIKNRLLERKPRRYPLTSHLNYPQLMSLINTLNIAGESGQYNIIMYILTQLEDLPGQEALPYLVKSGNLSLIEKIINDFNPDERIFNDAIRRLLTDDIDRAILYYLFERHPNINSVADSVDIRSLDIDMVRVMIDNGFDRYDVLL